MGEEDNKPMGEVICIDEARVKDHLGEMVRGTVEGEAEKQSHAIARRT